MIFSINELDCGCSDLPFQLLLSSTRFAWPHSSASGLIHFVESARTALASRSAFYSSLANARIA
jgi:hypothetical protein